MNTFQTDNDDHERLELERKKGRLKSSKSIYKGVRYGYSLSATLFDLDLQYYITKDK